MKKTGPIHRSSYDKIGPIVVCCNIEGEYRESETSQVELFEDLEFGGALPKLPVEIWGLKPGGWTGDITYMGLL